MKWNFQSTAIVGSGAIGLYYGGRLAQAGRDVRFLSRSSARLISAQGIHVESVHGDFHLPSPHAFPTPETIGPVDLVIVAWKTTANPALAATLAPLLHPGTQVLTLQNGLGNCEAIADIIDPSRVLGGLCFVCINRVSPRHIVHSAGGKISIGEWGTGIPGRADALVEAFKSANVPSSPASDLRRAQWEKLLWNIPFNGLSIAEGGVTTDHLLDHGPIEREIRALMGEIVAASAAIGHPIEHSLIDFNIERTRPMGAYRTSSMIDYLAGLEVEVDSIWREPVRRARAAGMDMPHTTALLERIISRLAAR